MLKLALGTALCFLLALAIFVLQNSEVVELEFLFWEVASSGAVLFPVIFAAGAAAGGLFGVALALHLRRPASSSRSS